MVVSRVIQCLHEPLYSDRPVRVSPPARACQPAMRRGTREAEPHAVILGLSAEGAEDVVGVSFIVGQFIACALVARRR